MAGDLSSADKIIQQNNLHRLSWILSNCLINSVVVHNVPDQKLLKSEPWGTVFTPFIVLVGHACMNMACPHALTWAASCISQAVIGWT